MDNESSKATQMPSDYPSEAELEEGRRNSTMTRNEALRALDRCARVCAVVREAYHKEREVFSVYRDEIRQRAPDLYFELEKQREKAAGVPQSSK